MKNALLLISLASMVAGCGTFDSLRTFKQPELHNPIIREASVLKSFGITNSFTNADFAKGTNGVVAYFQVASDQDVAEEFGRTFSACFYVVRLEFKIQIQTVSWPIAHLYR